VLGVSGRPCTVPRCPTRGGRGPALRGVLRQSFVAFSATYRNCFRPCELLPFSTTVSPVTPRGSDSLALVVPCGAATIAVYDPYTYNWYQDGLEPRRFRDLGAKYSGRCHKLVDMFLKRQSRMIKHAEWTSGGELKGVVADLKRVLRALGCDDDVVEQIIVNEWGEGYRLNDDYARDLPEFAVSAVEAAVRSRPSPSATQPLDLPSFAWLAELVEQVRSGAWTLVQVLPGNGAEDVVGILRDALVDSQIITLDIAAIADRSQLRSAVAGGELTDPANSSEYQIAQAAAHSRELLTIVVRGWGAHEQRFGVASLTGIAEGLHAFVNVHKPRVVIVVVSPVPTNHLIPPAADGSLLGLARVTQHAADLERLEEWARVKLTGLNEADLEGLITAADGQLAAVRAASRTRSTLDERLGQISAAHERSGDSILASVGSCCLEVLNGSSSKTECVRALTSAGILVPDARSYRPRVRAWAVNWKGLGKL
jgi:hypothetical protein